MSDEEGKELLITLKKCCGKLDKKRILFSMKGGNKDWDRKKLCI